MTQVIVGVFDSFEEADGAVSRLVQGGLRRDDMEVHANDQLGAAGERTVDADKPAASTASEEVGVFGKVERFFSNMFGSDDRPEEVGHYQEAVRRGGALLTVSVTDEAQVAMVRSALHEAGAVDIDERVAQWKSSGYSGFDSTARPYTADEVTAERQAFAVTRESLDVGKREVDSGGVRVYSRATETPVTETVNLREEHATIERRPVDRVATAADLKEGSVEIRETAEHAVVAKTAHVVEEVVVGREATEHTETINETLRGTDVEVEHDGRRDSGLKSVDPELPADARSVNDTSTVTSGKAT
ncbi:YsnF/AvaK domain-containing protein [Pararobbsia alpina]|uniref:Stress response protein YsnF n=1 Tax=Pararobbsia alpina TaxID=621374 RepID=A0A6S7CD35_9BURK|nr:YsnF/AvaK domain-containing protein [Pararobbsia alpina]CAB3806597.1 Stress response protein YsnF [Pararobbsia alpina]